MSIPTLTLTPSGQVVFLPDGGDSPALPDMAVARIGDAFHEGAAAGLLHLATAELTTPLPPDFAFWRDFSRRCLTRFCRIAAVESEGPDIAAPPPSSGIWARWRMIMSAFIPSSLGLGLLMR